MEAVTRLIFYIIALVIATSSSLDINAEAAGYAPVFMRPVIPDRVALVNETTKLECWVKGKPSPFLVWYFRGKDIIPNDRISISKYGLRISNLQLSDAGKYKCKASNEHGVIFGSISLKVIGSVGPPTWSNKKDTVNYLARPATGSVIMECEVRRNQASNITWHKDGNNWKRLRIRSCNGDVGITELQITMTGWKLEIVELTRKDKGNYSCIIMNEFGSINWTYKLDVIERLPVAPIIEDVKNQTVVQGTNATFTCKIVMSDSQPLLQWLRHYKVNDSFVNEKEPYVNIMQQSGFLKTIDDPQYLVLTNVTEEDEGWYTCLVANTVGMNYRSAWLEVLNETEVVARQNNQMDMIAVPVVNPQDQVHNGMPVSIVSMGAICAAVLVIIIIIVVKCYTRKTKCYMRKTSIPANTEVTRALVMRQNDLDYTQRNGNDPATKPLVNSQVSSGMDSKSELPRDGLTLGKELGSGAFGVARHGDAIDVDSRVGAVEMLKDSEIDHAKMRIVREHIGYYPDKVIGKGSSAIVYEGWYQCGQRRQTSEGFRIAVKCLDRGDAREIQEELEEFYREIVMLGKIEPQRHPNVVGFYGSEIMLNKLYIGFEFCHGTLKDYVEKKNEHWRESFEPRKVNNDMASGLNFLHERNIVHRDLKPENIFFVIDGVDVQRVVVGDLGSAKATCHSLHLATNGIGGTYGYIAPEAWNAIKQLKSGDPIETYLTKRTDIFSLGVLFYFAITSGHSPYGPEMTSQTIIADETPPTFDHLECKDGPIYHLLNTMLKTNPEERPTADDVCRHPTMWEPERVLKFFKEKSDAFEALIKKDASKQGILEHTFLLPNGNWMRNLPPELRTYLQKPVNGIQLYVGRGSSARFLLRAIRNIDNHFRNMPEDVKSVLGSYPDGHVYFWLKRFPKILMRVHDVLGGVGH